MKNTLVPTQNDSEFALGRLGRVFFCGSLFLAGAIATLHGVCLFKLECLTYDKFFQIRWSPESMETRHPWLSAEYVWLIEGGEISGYPRANDSRRLIRIFFDHFPCVTNQWRRDQHLPPMHVEGPPRSPWTTQPQREEIELFCLPFEFRKMAENDLLNYRMVQIFKHPDFARPLVTVWLAATIQAACSFVLMGGILRLAILSQMIPFSRHRLHLMLPMPFAAAIICTIPRLMVVGYAVCYQAAPLSRLGRIRWDPLRELNHMTMEVSSFAWFSALLLVSTVLALFAMTNGLRASANRTPSLRPWCNRFARTTAWSLVLAFVAWAILSILVYEPLLLWEAPFMVHPLRWW